MLNEKRFEKISFQKIKKPTIRKSNFNDNNLNRIIRGSKLKNLKLIKIKE